MHLSKSFLVLCVATYATAAPIPEIKTHKLLEDEVIPSSTLETNINQLASGPEDNHYIASPPTPHSPFHSHVNYLEARAMVSKAAGKPAARASKAAPISRAKSTPPTTRPGVRKAANSLAPKGTTSTKNQVGSRMVQTKTSNALLPTKQANGRPAIKSNKP